MNRLALKEMIIALILALSSFSLLNARTLYLSQSGNDSSLCQHGAAFLTLKRAVECLAPGDTLFIRNGVYPGGATVSINAAEEKPLVIRGESLEAIISGSGSAQDAIRVDHASHIIIERLTVREARRAGVGVLNSHHIRITGGRFADNGVWGIFTGFADDIQFENNECYGSKREHGIYHSNSGDRFIIRGNLVHDNNMCGIHLNGDPEIKGGDGVLNMGLVEKNIVYGNGIKGGAAINMTHVQDALVRNNLIYNNLAGGFTVYQDTGTFEQGSKRVLIIGNTVFFKPGEGRCGVNVQTTSEKVVIAGNIFVSGGKRGTFQVDSDHLGSIVSDCNILWGVDQKGIVERKEQFLSLAAWRDLAGNDRRSLDADPRFRNIDSSDFRPAPGSPAVDAGMPPDTLRAILASLGGCEWLIDQLEKLPAEDIQGVPRPQGLSPDAGAYENGK